jgi:hypothetical protein
MKQWLRTQVGWWLAWLVFTAVGAVWLARAELAQLQQALEADVRIAHRLMSQQMVQYDAVLATLALLETGSGAERPEQRLSSVYPSILRVQGVRGTNPGPMRSTRLPWPRRKRVRAPNAEPKWLRSILRRADTSS